MLSLPPGGRRAVSDFIWDELGKDSRGGPRLVSAAGGNTSLFYAAERGYSLFHTCNGWVADLLHAAGLPISSDGVVLAGQVMSRSAEAAAGQCVPGASARPS